jgi:hypothetical protein
LGSLEDHRKDKTLDTELKEGLFMPKEMPHDAAAQQKNPLNVNSNL